MPDESGIALTPLRAGPVLVWLDGVDLRSIGLGSEALLDRVYVAVRAADWSTVPGDVTDLEVETYERSFRVSFEVRHRAGNLDVIWRGRIVGTDDGVIECHMDGEAKSDFDYCRVGFCVHHPGRLAGAPYRAHTAAGEVSGALPRLVAPQLLHGGGVMPPLPWFDRLTVTSPAAETVTIESHGEQFELEDQRNWTDASFKSYTPPIRPGYPYRSRRGQRFEQRIAIRVEGSSPARVNGRDGPVRVELGPVSGHPLPPIGLGLPHRPGTPGPEVLEHLAALRPDHLRVSLWTDRADVDSMADAATRQALAVGCPLEAALFVDAGDPGALRKVVAMVAAGPVPVVRWLAYDTADTYRRSTSEEVARLVRDTLDEIVPGAVLGAGTASDFVRLNRGRTLYDGVDGLAWAISPSFHAADDRSVMENAHAQGVTVETARAFAEGRGLWVGPVELSRHDLRADPRQSTAIAAAWTVASLADLCAAGPDALTYFETIGPRGVIAMDGEPSPVLAVFEQLARMCGGRMRPLEPSVRHEVAGLIVDQGGRPVGMVANLTARPRRALILGLGGELLDQLLGPYEVACIG